MTTCRQCGHEHDCEKISAKRKRQLEKEQEAKLAAQRRAMIERELEIEFRKKRIARAVIFQMYANEVPSKKILSWVKSKLKCSDANARYEVNVVLGEITSAMTKAADERFLPCGTKDKPHQMTFGGITGRYCGRDGCNYVEYLHCASDVPFATACGRAWGPGTGRSIERAPSSIGAIVTCAECCSIAGIDRLDGTGARWGSKPWHAKLDADRSRSSPAL